MVSHWKLIKIILVLEYQSKSENHTIILIDAEIMFDKI